MQLAKDIGITQKSAWFVLHRLREAVGKDLDKLSGQVEIDETFIGGFDRMTDAVFAYKPKPKTKAAKRRARRKHEFYLGAVKALPLRRQRRRPRRPGELRSRDGIRVGAGK